MKRKNVILVILLSVVIIMGLLNFLKIGEKRIYLSLLANEVLHDGHFIGFDEDESEENSFIVRDGILYLHIQTIREYPIRGVVELNPWNIEEIRKIVNTHENIDLENYDIKLENWIGFNIAGEI